MLAERGAKYGVEVGTDHGQYAQQLCVGIPNLTLVCIDPWLAYTEGEDVHDQIEVDAIYEEAKNRLAPYDALLVRRTSMDALDQFYNNSLDFVFIDGNHDYDHVLEDIDGWTDKVKPGGVIAGHDYRQDSTRNYGVIRAVKEYTEEYSIAPLFEFRGGGKLVPCWMFFKQP